MDDATPRDFARSPVEQFARFLMVSAKEDPSLLRRTPTSPVPFLERVRDLPTMLGPRPELDAPPRIDHYLEELVALAIASAREAEDASREAHAAIARARRGTFALASVAALGILVGGAGVLWSRLGIDAISVAGMIPGATVGDISVANADPVGPNDVNGPGQSTGSRVATSSAAPEDEGSHPASAAPAPAAQTPGSNGADARTEAVSIVSAKDETSDVSAPARQQADAGKSPLPVAMQAPPDAPGVADDHPVSTTDTGRVSQPPGHAEQRPVSHRAQRHVRYYTRYTRYAYARPLDPFSRFLTEIHWRISSAFR